MTEIERVESTATELYGSGEDVQQMVNAIREFAPWADDMKKEDVISVVMRAKALGLDPLNGHEVQIWKDRGRVQFQIAYTMMVAWVRRFFGEHTNPRYRELTEEEKERKGIPAEDVAVEARFLMKSDYPMLRELTHEVGLDAKDALEMLEKVGIGVVKREDWNNKYFAPNGRSKMWKCEKRALTDAYRRAFGTPSKGEIKELRRAGVLGRDAIPEEEKDHRAEALPSPHARGSLFKTGQDEEPEPEVVEGETVEVVEESEEPEVAPEQNGDTVEEEPEVEAPEHPPKLEDGVLQVEVPAWVKKASWMQFKAGIVKQFEGYTDEKQVIGAIRAQYGEDFRPWLHWNETAADKCYLAAVIFDQTGDEAPDDDPQRPFWDEDEDEIPW